MGIFRLQRTLCHEGVGAGATTIDVTKRIASKDDLLVDYGGALVDKADYSIALDTPSAGTTRITFTFPLTAGVKVKVYG